MSEEKQEEEMDQGKEGREDKVSMYISFTTYGLHVLHHYCWYTPTYTRAT